jgi:hypothetical protein
MSNCPSLRPLTRGVVLASSSLRSKSGYAFRNERMADVTTGLKGAELVNPTLSDPVSPRAARLRCLNGALGL